jgi:RNA polymerase sigma-70 factor, ECF subfamily
MASGARDESPDALLNRARHGDDTALERLFQLYRAYLVTLARPQIRRRLQGKVDASDLAQETMLEAHRCFTQFRGASMLEFAGWLRGILAHRLAQHARHFLDAKARDANLEQSLALELDNASTAD